MRSESSLGPALLALALLAATGCSGMPLRSRFQLLDPAEQKAFIATYPELSEAERRRLEDGGYPKKLTPQQESRISDRIASLDIEASPSAESYSKEKTVILKAWLRYEDGRRADATRDVTWSVQPGFARLDGNELLLECAHSDVEVSAEFFGQRTGRRTFRIRKPLEEIEIRQDQAFSGFNVDGIARVLLQAFCQDRSSSDVSCQATWKSRSPAIEIAGCGYVRVRDPELLAKDPAVNVEATYGGLKSARKLRFTPTRAVPAR